MAMDDDKKQPLDEAAAAELKGVPEELLDGGEGEDGSILDELGKLQDELASAQQDVLYAQAETQNVRRRLEKDMADARAYAVTGFAREILSVADNLARALQAVPPEMREDEKLKGLLAGIEATQREIDKVFVAHGITRIAAMGLPLDPNQHQAMLEIPSNDAAPGTIVQEMQPGYMIKDRLLRPAMVGVAKKPD
jgi:molecular chaperone GrpE